jgi:hypothetical protein
MVWEFKQALFVSQRKVSPQRVADLSNPSIREQIQAHIDSSGTLPPQGSPDEYAALFEAVYPAEGDRRIYLDAKIAGAKPSYGHIALATLMRAGHARLVWTTNFDPLLADACAKTYDGTGYLATVALDAPDLARQLINDGRWPIEVKLHGDFRSRRLKNTSDEIRLQDERLRQLLLDSCEHSGLVIAGYSGRDSSVMDTLEEATGRDGAYPAGLFWLHRGEDPPFGRVSELLSRAVEVGIEAALIRIENFDELMRDLLRLQTGIDTRTLNDFAIGPRRRSPVPFPVGSRGWPVLRLNALPILQSPSVCRRVVCGIGGYSEVRGAVESAAVNVIVARTKAGVLGFGADPDMRSAFDAYGITDFDLHTIETKRLRYESGERGLLQEALTLAILRNRELNGIRRASVNLLFPTNPQDKMFVELRNQVGVLAGHVKGMPELQWHEGVGIRLEWADDRLWLLIEPRTVFEGITVGNKAIAADFARERTVKRYNRQLNGLVGFWAKFIAGDGGDLRSLCIGDGVDAVFRLGADTAFSRRSGA